MYGKITVISLIIWPYPPNTEERVGKEMYSVLFAHPKVEAITTWDFSDGCWLKAPSGFVREDNSEKPSFRMLRKLIHETWETHETLYTDENGFLAFTGFRGGYTLRSEVGSAAFELTEDLQAQLRLSR